jgi:nucleotide-binding universal stress UspA family protein
MVWEKRYKTILVGTDGSDSSFLAVTRAGEISARIESPLVIATAYLPSGSPHPVEILKDESYKVSGNAPIYAILQDAKERAEEAGARNIEVKAVKGAPVDALVKVAEEVKADLLVVGNVGLATVAGRFLGSVAGNVARKTNCDVLIVHTSHTK